MPTTIMQTLSADYVRGLITTEEWQHQSRGLTSLMWTVDGVAMERHAISLCSHCGDVVEWSDGCVEYERWEIDGKLYCSMDCAEEAGYRYCSNCEEWNDELNGFEAGDEWFCSPDCAENAGYRQCDHCGDWHGDEDEVETNDGKWFCSPDCAHEAGYECCEHCGEWHDEYDSIVPENGYERYCSEDCAIADGLFYCDRCEAWYKETRCVDSYTVHTHGAEQTWCESCRSNYAFYCDGCDELYDDDHYGEDGYCAQCCGGHALHQYGYRPPIVFFGGFEWQRDTPFLGIELETDSGENRRGYVDELDALTRFSEHFWMTQDSSLTNGVEITGQPMTLAYHESLFDLYEEIRGTARQFGYVSHNSGNCGLHIHVNRSFFGRTKAMQDAGGYKMLRALQRFEHQFTVFSRRTDNYWCQYRTREDYTPSKKYGKVLYNMSDFRFKSGSAANCRVHEQCLNFQHSSTFEFRIFRGTLKLETLFASMGLVNGLCHLAKKRGSMFFETCDWYTLIQQIVENVDTEYAKDCLVAYLEERGLN